VHDRPNGEFEIFPKTELTRLVLHQLGVALGFFLPPILVKDHKNIDDIGADLKLMFYIVAGVCTALFLVVVIGKDHYFPKIFSITSKRYSIQAFKLNRLFLRMRHALHLNRHSR
jgi:hypothetical protein